MVATAQRGDQQYAAVLGRLYVDTLGPEIYLEICNRLQPDHAAANNSAFLEWSANNAPAIAEIKRRMDAYPEYWSKANRQPASAFRSQLARLVAQQKDALEQELTGYGPERSGIACRKYPEVSLAPLADLAAARRTQLETIRRGPQT